ncbi:MAG: hypothetical protein F7B18_02820 [Desulfurococcales archaeon]|nr:hypothetical protein [Desulfurococcales archaeon]
MQGVPLPRSMVVVRMFMALLEGPLHARELREVAGLAYSRWVYPYLRYWMRLGVVRCRRGLYGCLYEFQPAARPVARELVAVLEEAGRGDLVLKALLRRLAAKGLRRRIYADLVRAMYILLRDRRDTSPYIRFESVELLASLFLQVLEERGYTREEILEALELLNQAGVIIYNKPGDYPGYSVAFRPAFVRGLGVPAPPPYGGRRRRRRRFLL